MDGAILCDIFASQRQRFSQTSVLFWCIVFDQSKVEVEIG
jgi:hypothetical protein